jgi:hypothetical protein
MGGGVGLVVDGLCDGVCGHVAITSVTRPTRRITSRSQASRERITSRSQASLGYITSTSQASHRWDGVDAFTGRYKSALN